MKMDIKWIIGTIVIIGGLVYGAMLYHDLPKKVAKNTDNVQKLAGTVETYVVEQRHMQNEWDRRDKDRDRREELIIELIKEAK